MRATGGHIMTAMQSYLSQSIYNYDFVVATTQASINATMKVFLGKLKEPVANVCFIANDRGDPMPIDYATLVNNANGSDPFKVPASADPTTNQDIHNLASARFMAGFRARLGLPPGYKDPTKIPDLVELGNNTASVTFNMLCSEFTIIEYNPGGGWAPKPSWTVASQPPGGAWIFQSKVDLRLSLVERGAYNSLPEDVKRAIMNLGGDAFSIRQLLFDFSNAGLAAQQPVLGDAKISEKVRTLLNQYFLGTYFTALQSEGQPMLGAAVSHNVISLSTMTLTSLNFAVNPFYGTNGQPILQPTEEQKALATLNYLCAADGHPLPPSVQFNWNWIDPAERRDYHGIVAINRAPFANYFNNQLHAYAQRNCLKPSAELTITELKASMSSGEAPNVSFPATGPTVLSYAHSASCYSQMPGDPAGAFGHCSFTCSFNLDVKFSGNTINITQHLIVYFDIQGLFGVSNSGNIIDKKIEDVYTVAVSKDGNLTASLESTPTDSSVDPQRNGWDDFWSGGVNGVERNVSTWVRDFTSRNFNAVPLSVIRNYVFPGGRTFAFKAVAFSDHQDLIAHITYADPT
jgi:hypothetical protein